MKKTILMAAMLLSACMSSTPDYKMSCDFVKCGENSVGSYCSPDLIICDYKDVDFKGNTYSWLSIEFAKDSDNTCFYIWGWDGY